MSTIANLSVILSARAQGFNRVLSGANASLQGLQGTVQKVTGYMKYLFAAAAGAGLVVLAKNAMTDIDRIAKLSDTMGIATEDIVKFEHAARLADVSTGELTMGFRFLARNLGNAKLGMTEAVDAFKNIGLSSEKLLAKSPAEAFKDVAERIKNIPSPALRASAAMSIFGRSGMRLIPLLLEGKEGLDALGKGAEKLGLTFDRVDAAKVEAANDAMTRIGEVFKGAVQTAMIQFVPLIEAAAKAFTDWATSGEGAGMKIVNAFEWVTIAIAKVADFMEEMKTGIWSLGLTFTDVALMGAQAFQSVFSTIESVYNRMVGLVNALIDKVRMVAKKLPGGGMISSGLEMAKLPEAHLSDTTAPYVAAAVEVQKQKWDELYKYIGNRQWPSAQVKAFFQKIKDNAADARAALIKTAEEKRKLAVEFEKAEEFRKAGEQVDEYNKKLGEMVQNFGKTDIQIQIDKLKELGTTLDPTYQELFNKELEKTIALQGQFDALTIGKKRADEAIKAQEDFIASGKAVFEETRTPLEKYEEKIGQLSEMLNKGVITWDTYGRAARAAREEMEGTGKLDTGTFQTIRTSLVDVKGLQMGAKDPLVEKADETNNLLGDIRDDIRETRFQTEALA